MAVAKSECLSKAKTYLDAAQAELHAWGELMLRYPSPAAYLHFYQEALNHRDAAKAAIDGASDNRPEHMLDLKIR
jgi:hypothetical protein